MRSRRLKDFDDVVQSHLSPPRTRLEHAVLQAASAARSDDAAVARLAHAVHRGRTTPARLRAKLDSLIRLRRRRLLAEVLEDVAAGALSALERRYLRDVERSHGLPRGRRQLREAVSGRAAYRDVVYPEQDTIVELDGVLGHDDAVDRWNDIDRDIDAATTGRLTVRAGWRQALSPCRLALAIGAILAARGWTGTIRACGPDCQAAPRDVGGSSASDAGDPPVSTDSAA